jgi:hypothetical protein
MRLFDVDLFGDLGRRKFKAVRGIDRQSIRRGAQVSI